MSPEHRNYAKSFCANFQADPEGFKNSFVDPTLLQQEPSARSGILNERFCIGPKNCPVEYQGKDTEELFFPRNVWPPPEKTPGLEPALSELYIKMERASEMVLLAVARSLDVSTEIVQPFVSRHCSNLQIANYPSQLQRERIASPIRVKAHADSGTVTLLIRQVLSESKSRAGLQILTRSNEWASVPPLSPGAIMVNLGNLASLWTGGEYVSTKHRVVNPSQPGPNRRVSIAYFQKPDPEAFFVPLIETSVTATSAREGTTSMVSGPSENVGKRPLEAGIVGGGEGRVPVRIRELTRVGILHKYRHLGHKEASRRYHLEMASPYLEGSDDAA
ncbi:unnamed protein product [Choristocarpus tenellus]